jgi:hypothetical protein
MKLNEPPEGTPPGVAGKIDAAALDRAIQALRESDFKNPYPKYYYFPYPPLWRMRFCLWRFLCERRGNHG